MAEYRLAPKAERDLELIWRHTRVQWGSEQADRYLDILTTAFEEAAEQPQLFSSCDWVRKGYRRRFVERHVIYYRITKYGVAIVRILHDRMDAPRHLQK